MNPIKQRLREGRRRLARHLRRTAARLDPPTDPYGEWDARSGQLIIKMPTGSGGSMPLARVDISPGAIHTERQAKEWP